MKIISKINPRIQPVYDMEIPNNHNFILANGSIAHNCAHSTSYGILCHNGIYLKHKYPAHYWLGELSVRDDQETIRDYLQECSKYILQVDILKSHPTEWLVEDVNGKEMLRPPLCSVKGCGHKSVESLKLFMEAKYPKDLKFSSVVSETEDMGDEEATKYSSNRIVEGWEEIEE